MMFEDLAVGCGVVAIILALPGLGLRRFGPLPARIAALLALAALWIAALDWPESIQQRSPREVIAVTTSGAHPVLAALRARIEAEDGAQFELSLAPGSLAERLLRAGLRRPDAELLLVWDGPFTPDANDPQVIEGLVALSLVPRARVEPMWFELRSLGVLEAERPAAFELRLADAATALPGSGTLQVLDARDEVLAEMKFAAEDLERPLLLNIETLPGGVHQLRLAIDFGDAGKITASGSLEVQPASLVRVIGAGSRVESLVAALRAQGLPGIVTREIPEPLDPSEVLLFSAAIPASLQTRLATFLDDGGGLFLIGGEDGGALPSPDEPLHAFLPVIRRSTPAETDSATDSDSEIEAVPDAPPDPNPNPDPAVETPPTGDTSEAADPTSLEPGEVERRQIALILVVDRSGSMGQLARGGRTKMDDAKRSAYETASNLEAGDSLGLIAFGARDQVILDLGPIPSDRALREAFATLHAEDRQTVVAGALQLARKLLSESNSPVRHVIVITDGELAPDDVPLAKATARSMASQGITVSVIQVLSPGDTASALDVMRIAEFGRGVLHRSENAGAIPSLVFAEVRRVLGSVGRRPASEVGMEPDSLSEPKPEPEPEPEPEPKPEPEAEPESASEPRSESEGILRVFPVVDSVLLVPEPEQGYPRIYGILPVTGRPEARVLLAAGDRGTPLLAFANRGLGRIAVWTSDLFAAWGRDWAADAHLPSRLATWVSHLRPVKHSADAALMLTDGSMNPAAPTGAEWQRIEAMAAAPLQLLEEYQPPAASWQRIERGRAADLALWAALSILLLALVEFSLRRRGNEMTAARSAL